MLYTMSVDRFNYILTTSRTSSRRRDWDASFLVFQFVEFRIIVCSILRFHLTFKKSFSKYSIIVDWALSSVGASILDETFLWLLPFNYLNILRLVCLLLMTVFRRMNGCCVDRWNGSRYWVCAFSHWIYIWIVFRPYIKFIQYTINTPNEDKNDKTTLIIIANSLGAALSRAGDIAMQPNKA